MAITISTREKQELISLLFMEHNAALKVAATKKRLDLAQ
jgi:hypothetical protein